MTRMDLLLPRRRMKVHRNFPRLIKLRSEERKRRILKVHLPQILEESQVMSESSSPREDKSLVVPSRTKLTIPSHS